MQWIYKMIYKTMRDTNKHFNVETQALNYTF